MSKNSNQGEDTGAEIVSKQVMLPVEQLKNREVGVGFTAHGSVQDVRLLTEVKYRRAVQGNIKTQIEVKKAADAKVKAASEEVVKAFAALRPPKEFIADVKSLHNELKRFFPGAILPTFVAKTSAASNADEEDDAAIEEAAKPGAGNITIGDVHGKSQYQVEGTFTDSANAGRTLLTVRRQYPYTKEIEAALHDRNLATVAAAAAEAKLVELRSVLAGVGAVADDAAAVVAQFNLQQSGELGSNLLGAIGDMLEKRAKADGIDTSAEPAALALTAPTAPTGRSRS